jgi:hypothetical protein
VWEPNDRDAWVADAQRWITQIKGVKQCRIVLDDQGEIEEVLVVAGLEKAPRMIVRDVETLLKIRLDKEVYFKKISVTQLIDSRPDFANPDDSDTIIPLTQDPEQVTHHDTRSFFGEGHLPPAATDPSPEDRTQEPAVSPAAGDQPIPAVILAEEPSPRIVCANVGVMASDMVVRAEVHLRAGDVEALGTVEGPNHAESDTVLVARATVEAIGKLLVDPVLLHVKEVRLETLGGQTVVLAAIDLVEGRSSDTLFGACSTRHNRQQAVVYSVLDALNRRLSLFALKTAQAEG